MNGLQVINPLSPLFTGASREALGSVTPNVWTKTSYGPIWIGSDPCCCQWVTLHYIWDWASLCRTQRECISVFEERIKMKIKLIWVEQSNLMSEFGDAVTDFVSGTI
ncbi:hypothetical protein EV2_040928 [Malus domestica]